MCSCVLRHLHKERLFKYSSLVSLKSHNVETLQHFKMGAQLHMYTGKNKHLSIIIGNVNMLTYHSKVCVEFTLFIKVYLKS